MSHKIFAFEKLTDTAATWALEQVADKHPVQNRSETLDVLVGQYEYNRFGDIVDEIVREDTPASLKHPHMR